MKQYRSRIKTEESINISKIKINTSDVDEDYKNDVSDKEKEIRKEISSWDKDFRLKLPVVKVETEVVTIKNVNGNLFLDTYAELDEENYTLVLELSNGDKIEANKVYGNRVEVSINGKKAGFAFDPSIEDINDFIDVYREYREDQISSIIDSLT